MFFYILFKLKFCEMAAFARQNNLLLFKGCNFFKQRVLLATLSGKPIKIIEIRSNDVEPGLRDFEINLLQLLDKVTNGTKIEISQTGTQLYYHPGLLSGGLVNHDCSIERGIGYYMDVLLAVGPFCKTPLTVTFKGVTNSTESPSVDHIKASAFPLLKKFIVVDDGLELKIVKRGVMPDGGGEVLFKCPVRKNLRPVQFLNAGMVKRIRGTVYAAKVSPAMANRTVEAAKGVLLNFIPDIYIHTDQHKGKSSGKSPGYGVNLIAETNEGVFYSAEVISGVPGDGKEPSVPEDLGQEAAHKLLYEIYRGGCVDSTFQWLAALYMALGQKDVSKYLTGPFSNYTVHFLQHLREFFSVTFKLEDEVAENDDDVTGSSKVQMTCVGIGYTNINKRML